MVAIRHKANGSVDSSYGTSGFTYMYSAASIGNYCYGAGIQSDHSLIMGGDVFSTNYSFAACRLTPAGKPDFSFGNNGFCTLHIGSPTADNVGYATAIQSDDKILIAGSSTGTGNYDFTVVRFTKNGKPDSTFGKNGAVVLPIGTGNDNCYSMALQKDGKILLGGDIELGGNYVFTLVRLFQNGTLDSTFANKGILIKSLGSADDDYGYSLKVLSNQSILLGGTAKNNGNYNCCVLKVRPNGTLDSSFGKKGIFIQGFSPTSADYGQAMEIHPINGKIAMTVRSFVTGSSLGIMLIKPNGTVDSSFGNNGTVIQKIGVAQHFTYTIAIQSDGKILQGGYANLGAPVKQAMFRYHSGLPPIPLNVQKLKTTNELLITPNPAYDKIEIKLPKNEINFELIILNSAGKPVYQNVIKNGTNIIKIDSLS
jgi:uncharacterized delta-60 repeat protein